MPNLFACKPADRFILVYGRLVDLINRCGLFVNQPVYQERNPS